MMDTQYNILDSLERYHYINKSKADLLLAAFHARYEIEDDAEKYLIKAIELEPQNLEYQKQLDMFLQLKNISSYESSDEELSEDLSFSSGDVQLNDETIEEIDILELQNPGPMDLALSNIKQLDSSLPMDLTLLTGKKIHAYYQWFKRTQQQKLNDELINHEVDVFLAGKFQIKMKSM